LLYSIKTRQLTLGRFRELKNEKPRSKMVFLRGLYPEIAATLQMGHTLKDIHQRLVEDGVEVSYTVFLSYISRIRRERARSPFVQNRQRMTVPAPAEKAPAAREDPLASAMRALSKPRYDIREAMCDGDPTKKKLF
jgi:hypothetical protein